MQKSGIYGYEPLWNEWRIDGLIGKGSYGEVYKIYKIENGEKIEAAAKYISIPKSDNDIDIAISKGFATDDEDSLRSFFSTRANAFSKEIELMMKLQDAKNVVHYEAHIKEEKKEEIGWDIIIRMELLTALDKYLRENQFERKDVIRLGIDMCRAIENCQKEKIIHRDVKIENIFLDVYGNFKLGDFGVSREAKGTTMGTLTGTEDYMAPEISKHKEYNNNVDIYSIGIVMYRLLNNNRVPFLNPDGPINDTDIALALEKRINGIEEMPFPKYAEGKLAEIILKACHYDRHQRYATPGEMANDLEKIFDEKDDLVVLKPRKRSYKSTTGKGTESDLPEKTLGGGTLSEIQTGERGTISDGGYSKGTISDFGGKTVPQPKKKKKSFIWWLLIPIIVACIAGIVVYFAMPKEDYEDEEIYIEEIELESDSIQAVVGETMQLEYTVLPENTTEELEFWSSDEDVVIIDEDGEMTFLSEGEAEITIESYEFETTVTVSVTPEEIPVTDILYVSEYEELTVGNNLHIQPGVVPDNATKQTPKFSTSNSEIATVDSDGVVTAVSAGQTTIKVKIDGITKTMVLLVKAKPEPEPEPEPEKPKINTENKSSSNKSTSKTKSTPKPQSTKEEKTNNNYNSSEVTPSTNNNTPTNGNAGTSNNSGGGNSNDKYRIDPGSGSGIESAM